ncbi:MAG: type IV pilin protein, partial [Planctomycetota bacterium]
MKRKTDKKRWGFTLVELLTTLAVIGVLLGLLIPALNEVTKKATQVKQKA